MKIFWALFKKEWQSFFASPLGFTFLFLFLILSNALTFFLGNFFERNQADLASFFLFQPWLALLLIPALSMKSWAEERKSGTIEILFTLPLSLPQMIAAKFLASWALAGLALILTTPLWLTISFLGSPDHGVVMAGYIGCFLMMGALTALGQAASAIMKNQISAFLLAAFFSFVLLASGTDLVMGWLRLFMPSAALGIFQSFSLLDAFHIMTKGLLTTRIFITHLLLMAFFLFLTWLSLVPTRHIKKERS